MIYGIIYKIVNNINNKIYIGQTTQLIKARFRDHCNLRKSIEKSAIRCAIKKYGKENFIITEIDNSINKEDLDKKEIFWINCYNSLCPNGYNLSLGGNGGGKMSSLTKEKISKIQTGKKSTAIWTNESRQRQSYNMLGDKNHRFGKYHSFETKQRMSLSHKGIPTPATCRPVICIETNKKYNSCREASKDIGICERQLFRLLKTKKKSIKYGVSFVLIGEIK
jgi:group I intron endonuclease